MKAVTILVIAFASVMFAQQQPSTADNQSTGPAQEKKATPPPSGTAATLYVYRLRNVSGMLNKPSVYIDEKEIARLANGRFFGVNVDPGQHVVRSTEKNSAVTLEMKAGQVYYIRLAFEPTRYTIRPETTLVRPEQAWAEMEQTKANDPKEIKNHELAFVDSMPSRPVATPENADECRSIAVTLFWFPAPGGYKVVDVFNYPGAYIGKVYQANALQAVQSRDHTNILVLTKGYTPEEVATAHNFCQSGPEMVEGTLAGSQLQADIKNKISTIDAVDHPNCALQIVKQWRSPRNPGEERWEVKSCDAISSWDVRMVPSPGGGTDFQVNKIDLEQKKKPDTAGAPPVNSQTGTAEASPKEEKAMSTPATTDQLKNQSSQQKPSDAQGRVTRLVESLEAAESGRVVDASEAEMKKGMEQADADMKVLLLERPDDPDLLVLSVRLERFHGSGMEAVSGKNAEAELDQAAQASRARTDGLATRLDRALVLQPNRADAYYWKARLYGVQQPVVRNGVFDYITLDLQESIRSGRRAVELAPDNVVYREALANYLLIDGKQDEAGEVMRTVAGGQHIISLLLADSKAVPLPSGAILDSSGSARFGEYEINAGRIHDHPTLRVHTYIIYKPFSEVLAFYRERWPGFQFFKIEDDSENDTVKTKDMEMQFWAQALRGPVNALRPVASKSDWDREAKHSELKPPNTDGPILFALTEIHRKSADAPKTLKMLTGDVPLQDITCLLTILDQREPGH